MNYIINIILLEARLATNIYIINVNGFNISFPKNSLIWYFSMASDAIDKTIDNAKSVCRSVLMANSYGILAQNFAKEYEGLTGGVRNEN